MPIRVQCPSCQKSYNALDRLAGKSVSCKECGGTIPVAAAATSTKSQKANDLPAANKAAPAKKATLPKKPTTKPAQPNAPGIEGLDALSAAVSADLNSPANPLGVPANPLLPPGVQPALGTRLPAPAPAKRKRRARSGPGLKFGLRQVGGVLALLLGIAIFSGIGYSLLTGNEAGYTNFGYARGVVSATVATLCGIAWLKGQTFGG